MTKPKKVVMLVDDETAVQGLYRRLFDRLDWEGRVYGDARQALAALSDDVDCIVTDMVMPGMDGIRFIREVHSRRGRMPILVTTGYATEASMRELAGLKVEVLAKPFDPALLLTRLEQLLQERKVG
ncbi:MAG TPA: response regulator [Planctomycetota bacterium]|nr:response regulator [Planctomycetota bacterium]